MQFIKNILKSSKEIIITYLLSYIIIIAFYLIFNNNTNYYINVISPLILILFYILVITYIYKKNYHKELSLNKKDYFPLLMLGISIAIFLNMLIFLFNPPKNINTIPLLISIILSGIIGPIYEELIFRYLLYNRLKKITTPTKSLLITTTIFALIHLLPIKIIYGAILGIILNIIYKHYQNIKAPIIIHIAANTIVIFLREYNTYLLILSLISLIISIKIILKKHPN